MYTSGNHQQEWLQKSSSGKPPKAFMQPNREDELRRLKNHTQKEDEDFKFLVRKWETLERASNLNRSLNYWLLPTVTSDNRYHKYPPEAKLVRPITKQHPAHPKQQEPLMLLSSLPQVISQKTFVNKLQDMEEKLLIKQEAGKDQGGNASAEYPGKSKTAQVELFVQWRKYYNCLQNQTSFTPKSHYVFPGGTIRYAK